MCARRCPGESKAGGGPAQHDLPGAPALDVAGHGLGDGDRGLDGVGGLEVRSRLGLRARRLTVSTSSNPSSMLAPAPGCCTLRCAAMALCTTFAGGIGSVASYTSTSQRLECRASVSGTHRLESG